MHVIAFGALLRGHRLRSGLSQEALAGRAAISVRNLRDLERGRVRRPRRDTVARLADALRLDGAERDAFVAATATGAAPPPARPAQLPAAPRLFVGRREELARLDALAAATPAIACVTGLGGIGKSALIMEWARRVQDRYAAGVLYADLRGYDGGSAARPEDVLAGFLQALGPRGERVPDGLDARAAAYRSTVADRRILVLLDNARDAAQARPLLPAGRATTAVVTSRNRLAELTALYDAAALRLGPLPPDDAVALLDAAIGTRLPDRRPLRRLAAGCGHLPLALRIAAAKLQQPGAPTVGALAERLTGAGRLDALRIGDDPRLVLRATFDSSYGALAPRAQRLLRLLARLPGPDADRRTVAAVAGPDTEDLLDQLLQAHLLEVRDDGRLALPDLLRDYAGTLAA